MKPWWLVAVVACGSQREPNSEPAPAAPRSDSRRSIDVQVTGAPISIRGVEIVRSSAPGVLELGYRVEAKDRNVSVPARVMCRVAGYNVVYPASEEGKVPGPRLATLFRPDPFAEDVGACQAEFFVDERRVAAACYVNDELVDGECPPGTFPPPPRTTELSVELTRAMLELRHGTALVSGLFTLVEPLAEGRRFATQIRCEDAAGVATGEGELAFLPLHRVPVGASMYGPVAIFLDRTPERDAVCDLRVVSRATRGAPTEQIHARYCLTTADARAGDCE